MEFYDLCQHVDERLEQPHLPIFPACEAFFANQTRKDLCVALELFRREPSANTGIRARNDRLFILWIMFLEVYPSL